MELVLGSEMSAKFQLVQSKLAAQAKGRSKLEIAVLASDARKRQSPRLM